MNDNKTAHTACEYDEKIEMTIPFYRAIHSEVLRIVQVYDPAPRKWLDTGCGTGSLVFAASERFPETEFRVCDPSKEMLDLAMEKNEGRRVMSMGTFSSAEIPGEYDRSFDVITAIQAHHYQDKRGRAASTRRCYESLKSGGLYITFENTSPLTHEGERLYKEYWRRFQIDAGKDEAAAQRHMDRYNVEYFPINVLEHLETLRSTGFAAVELFWYAYMQSGYLCIK
jgi:tRNA (cmo5U34)-methyltransferase